VELSGVLLGHPDDDGFGQNCVDGWRKERISIRISLLARARRNTRSVFFLSLTFLSFPFRGCLKGGLKGGFRKGFRRGFNLLRFPTHEPADFAAPPTAISLRPDLRLALDRIPP